MKMQQSDRRFGVIKKMLQYMAWNEKYTIIERKCYDYTRF